METMHCAEEEEALSPCRARVTKRLDPQTEQTRKRKRKSAIFVGQAPAEHSEPTAPLAGAAERRLAKLAGVSVDHLWQLCDRVNLLHHFPGKQATTRSATHQSVPDNFPLQAARQAAEQLDIHTYRLVVLLGHNVARSFKLPTPSLFCRYRFHDPEALWMVFPHPSGVSHFWNCEKRRQRASCELRRVLSQEFGGVMPRVVRSPYFNDGASEVTGSQQAESEPARKIRKMARIDEIDTTMSCR